jgi:DNA mismatch endonuclease, patch repair protein
MYWNTASSRRTTSFGGLSRSALMSRIRGKGNRTTELRLLNLLREHRVTGWKRHGSILGRPDFIWPKTKIAVFLHGCFWHGHDCGRNLLAKTNSEAWLTKIAVNRQRDRRVTRSLRRAGWSVLVIWECQLSRAPLRCVCRIERRLLHKATTHAHPRGARISD